MNWYDEVKGVFKIDEDKVLMSANYLKTLERDKFTCQDCGKKDELDKYKGWEKSGDTILEIHHIKPKNAGGTSELDNLITLCKGCHSRIHPHLRNKHSMK